MAAGWLGRTKLWVFLLSAIQLPFGVACCKRLLLKLTFQLCDSAFHNPLVVHLALFWSPRLVCPGGVRSQTAGYVEIFHKLKNFVDTYWQNDNVVSQSVHVPLGVPDAQL